MRDIFETNPYIYENFNCPLIYEQTLLTCWSIYHKKDVITGSRFRFNKSLYSGQRTMFLNLRDSSYSSKRTPQKNVLIQRVNKEGKMNKTHQYETYKNYSLIKLNETEKINQEPNPKDSGREPKASWRWPKSRTAQKFFLVGGCLWRELAGHNSLDLGATQGPNPRAQGDGPRVAVPKLGSAWRPQPKDRTPFGLKTHSNVLEIV